MDEQGNEIFSAVGRFQLYLGAHKSLARPGRKQAAPVKSVMGREMDWFS